MPFVAILLLFVTASMPFINPLTPRINSDLFAFMGLALFGWFTQRALAPQHQTFGFNGLSGLCAFWLLWACVQYILQINTGYFSHFLISISYLVAVILLTAWVGMWVQAQRSAELARAVMLAVWVAGMLAALAIGLQMLGWQTALSPWLQKSLSFPRQGGFLSQPNLSASLMVCAMLSLVFMFPSTPDRAAKPQWWRCLSMALLLAALCGTSSRTGYVEVLALGGLLVFFRKRFHIHGVWLALPVWLILALVVGEWMSAHQWVNAQLAADSVDAVTQSSSHRLRIWQDIGRMVQSAPWWGVGWRRLQVSEVLMPGIADPVDHAHNLLLQIQVELGILGSLALVVFGAHWVFKLKPWQFTRAHEVVMLAIAMSLGIHSMLEYPLWHALFLFLFAFALALLPGVGRSYPCPPMMTQGMASAMLVLTVWVFADYSMSQRAYEKFNQNGSQGGYVKANERVWWNKILLHSVFMTGTPINDDTKEVIRNIATENANIYSQTNFHNLPLLNVMIADGETAIANQLAWRLCRQLLAAARPRGAACSARRIAAPQAST
jgi:O-antigen ligase